MNLYGRLTSREVTRIKRTFNNLRWVSYSSRSVIIIIDFLWNVISKQYFSWTEMRPISPTQHCVSPGNVYKQTSPEIPEVTCTRCTIMGFLHETSLIWVISLGVKLCLVYFRSLHICKNLHINDKYVINIDYYMTFFLSYPLSALGHDISPGAKRLKGRYMNKLVARIKYIQKGS